MSILTPVNLEMATGPVIVSSNTGQQIEIDSDPSTSSMDPNYLSDAPDQSLNTRRHSMVFRSNRQSSSSDEDDLGDFSADLHDVRKRRYSMDLHRTRRSAKRNSFALSYSDNSTLKFQRSNTEDNSTYSKSATDQQFATPLAKKVNNF